MSGTADFLKAIVQAVLPQHPPLQLVSLGAGFSVGSPGSLWIQVVPPFKVKLKEGRCFFDGSPGSVKIRWSERRDGSCVFYVDILGSRESEVGHNLGIEVNEHFLRWIETEVKAVHENAQKEFDQHRRYLRYGSALALLDLEEDCTKDKIEAATRRAKAVAERFPEAAEYLGSLVWRARDTLLAAIREDEDFDPGEAYLDPLALPNAWHAARVFGVPEDAPPELVERAFTGLAKAVHPDHKGNRYFFQLAVRARKVMKSR